MQIATSGSSSGPGTAADTGLTGSVTRSEARAWLAHSPVSSSAHRTSSRVGRSAISHGAPEAAAIGVQERIVRGRGVRRWRPVAKRIEPWMERPEKVEPRHPVPSPTETVRGSGASS